MAHQFLGHVISIHGARVGPDDAGMCAPALFGKFQSTGPVWAPTIEVDGTEVDTEISIHGARVGPDGGSDSDVLIDLIISIHGARVGPDKYRDRTALSGGYFNPRGPCGPRRR